LTYRLDVSNIEYTDNLGYLNQTSWIIYWPWFIISSTKIYFKTYVIIYNFQ